MRSGGALGGLVLAISDSKALSHGGAHEEEMTPGLLLRGGGAVVLTGGLVMLFVGRKRVPKDPPTSLGSGTSMQLSLAPGRATFGARF